MTSIWPVVLDEAADDPVEPETCWPTSRLTAVTVPLIGEVMLAPVAWRLASVCCAWASDARSAAIWASVVGAVRVV